MDDHAENLLALEAVLEPIGQRLVTATSAAEALRQLLAEDFAVILLDVMMPDVDGLEAARLIRSRERSRTTPIIFLTAQDRDHQRVMAGYELGAVDFLFKPFDPDVLRAKVAVFVELHRVREHAAEHLRRAAAEHAELVRAQASQTATADARAHLDRVLMQTPAAVAVTRGAEHVFESVNAAYRQMFGEHGYIGRRAGEVFHLDRSQGVLALMDLVYATGEPHAVREVAVTVARDHAGAPDAFFNVVYQPLLDEHRRVYGIVTFAVDVTPEVRARGEAERRAADAAHFAQQLQAQAAELEQQSGAARKLATELARANAHLSERSRRDALGNAVGEAVAEGGRLDDVLQRCAGAVARHLDAALARVWTLDEGEGVLELRASAGAYRDADLAHHRIPLGAFKVGRIAAERAPYFTNDLASDPHVSDPEWVRREGMVAFAGYPLVARDRVVGALAMFARHPLSGGAHDALRSVVDRVALAVDRTEAHDQLRAREARYRALVDASTQVVWRADARGLVDDIPGWRALTGQTVEEVRGQGWADTVHPDDRALIAAAGFAAYRQRSAYQGEFRARMADGTYRWFRSRGVPVCAPGGEIQEWVGTFTDIDDRRRGEERKTFLDEAARALSATLDYEQTLSSLTRHCVPFLADYCSVDVLNATGEIRRVESAHADAEKEALLRDLWRRYPYRASDRVGVPEVLRTGSPALVPEFSDADVAAFAHDDEQLALLRALGPRSYICVPLVARGHALGALSLVMADSGRRYSSADLDVAVELARRGAVAVDNAHLYAAEQAARRTAEGAAERMALLQRLTAALSRSVTIADVAHAVVNEGLLALGAGAGSLALLAEGGEQLEIVGAREYPAELVETWRRFPLAAAVPLADAVRSRELVTVGSPEEMAARYPGLRASASTSPYLALAAVPLVLGDRVFGALGVSYAEPRAFGDEDRALLHALAALSAQAVERTQLHQAERRARERAAFLSDASALLASSLEYEVTLQRTADLAVPHLSDWCAVDLLDPDGAVRRVAVAHRDPEKLALGRELERRYPRDPASEFGLARVLRSGTTEVVAEITDAMLAGAARDADHLALMRAIGLTSVMFVPLVARGRTLGAMTFVASESGRHHGADDVALAEELAQRAAVAVDNARLFREARDARTAAEAANQSKSDFLATMSHEIRTPINAIIGYTQLLELGISGPITEEQRAQLERVSASGRHLLGLINDILDLSKIEAGRLTVSRAPAAAAESVDAALALIRPQAAAKGVALSVQSDDAHVVRYLGDDQRVQQVMVNLLSNAVKFTAPGGRVTVRLGLAARGPAGSTDAAGPWAYLTVEDTGIGIAADKLDTVFHPFEQADSGYTRAHSGTGLGLTISRRLARLMGGDLAVESAPGVGSRFTLWMPGVAGGAADAPPELAPANAPPTGRTAGAGDGEAREEREQALGGAGTEMAEVGRVLVRDVDEVVESFVDRMRADAALPSAGQLSDIQLRDHVATWLTDIGQALIILQSAVGEPAEMMRDGGEIQRVISDRHGAQRARLGWGEDAVRREFAHLRGAVDAVLARRAPGAAAEPGAARAMLARFIEQAEQVSVRAMRETAVTRET